MFCHKYSLAQTSSTTSTPPATDPTNSTASYVNSCAGLGRACNESIEKHVIIHDEASVSSSRLTLTELVNTEQLNYKNVSERLRTMALSPSSGRSSNQNTPSGPHLMFVSKSFLPVQGGQVASDNANVSTTMTILNPIFTRLQDGLSGADMAGLSNYVANVHASILLDAAADARMFVSRALQKTDQMFSTLRQTSNNLSVSPIVISLPQGATFALQTQQDLEKGLFTLPIISTNGQFINLYRGLYTFTVSMSPFVTGIGVLNLIDYPGTSIVCKLGSGGPAGATTCEVR
jgi:hypothetical protein